MVLLTFFLLTLLLLISYAIFNRDILAPPTVATLGLVFATLCCFYNEKKWMLDFSANTMWTLVVGVVCFIIGGALAILSLSMLRGGKLGYEYKPSEVNSIQIEVFKTWMMILFEVGTLVLLFVELRRITGSVLWLQVVSTYRAQTAFVNPEEYTMRLSSICRLAIDLSFALALIYAYVIGNNIAAKAKQPILNWLPVIIYCVMSFMQGYRSDMLRLWIAMLVVTYTLKKRKEGWKSSKETKKMIRTMALSVVGVAIVFIALRGTVGRAETDWDPMYYLAFYAGTSIASFDIFLKNPLSPSDIWGKETFYHLNQSIGAWFDKPELRYIFYKEFRRSPSGIFLGNVYTAFRSPYYDFGFEGMIIVEIIMGFFFVFFYYKLKDYRGKSPIDFRLLAFSYIAFSYFMYFYNCYYHFISFAFIRMLIELFVFRWLLVGVNVKGSAHKVRFTLKRR